MKGFSIFMGLYCEEFEKVIVLLFELIKARWHDSEFNREQRKRGTEQLGREIEETAVVCEL